MTRLLVAMFVALVVAVPAIARGLPSAGSGTIAVAAGSDLRFQGLVAFNTSGTDGLDNPRVWVACYQAGVLVYGEGGGPAQTFKLGGDSSIWVLNGGGPASCTAELYYIVGAHGKEWDGHGAQGGTVTLATTAFQAGP